MDQKKLRDCLGFFSTGVVIACAKRKNFLGNVILDVKRRGSHELEFIKSKLTRSSILAGSRMTNNILMKNLLAKLKKIFSDEFFGITINSFSSVSLDPPLVMFCIDNKSTNLRLFKKNRYFSLNVLSQEQRTLAAAFAKPKNNQKWEVEPYFFGQKGNPIFQNSLAFFECRRHRVIKCGDHHIIIGEVLDFGKINDKEPLIYYRSKYASLQK